MTRRAALLLYALAAAAPTIASVAPGAHAKPRAPERERDYDDQATDRTSFWARLAHPHYGSYLRELQRGKELISTRAAAAIEPLLEAIRYEPREPEAHFWLATAYSLTGQAAPCAIEYETLFALAPDFVAPMPRWNLRFEYALCLGIAGRVEESIVAYQDVLAVAELDRDHRGRAFYNLGDDYHVLGRLGEAVLAYRHALEVMPSLLSVHFALAVAYDRDEEAIAAEQEMELALRLDAALDSLKHTATIFVPAEDGDYYRGLAYQIAGRVQQAGQARTCPPWECRAMAVAYFRRFVVRAGDDGMWTPRARDHLTTLGGPELSEADVEIAAPDTFNRRPVIKAVVTAGPALQQCLVDEPHALFAVNVRVPAAAKDKNAKAEAPVAVTVKAVGPAGGSMGAQKCVVEAALALGVARGAVTIEINFPVLAP